MSDRETRDNARRAGKRAFQSGKAISENPMRTSMSRMAWREGFTDEKILQTFRAARKDDSLKSLAAPDNFS